MNLPSVSTICISITLIIIPTTPWRIISLLLTRMMLVMRLMLRARRGSSGGGPREWRSRSGMGTKGHSWIRCLSKACMRRSQGRGRPSEKRSQSISSNGSDIGVTPARNASGLDGDDPGPGRAISPALPACPPRKEVWVATMCAWGTCTRPTIHLPRRVHPGHVDDNGWREG
jgi:hypothetical protein